MYVNALRSDGVGWVAVTGRRSALDSILGSQEGLGVPNQEGKLLFFEKVEQDPEVLETLAALCFKYLLSSQ
eukprot:gene19518-23340_t